MKSTRRTWLIVAATMLAALVGVARHGGSFTSVGTCLPGRCAAVALGGGREHIQIDRRRGIAYLSPLDRAAVNRGEAQNGKPRFGETKICLSRVYGNPGFGISSGAVAARWRWEFPIGAFPDPKVHV